MGSENNNELFSRKTVKDGHTSRRNSELMDRDKTSGPSTKPLPKKLQKTLKSNQKVKFQFKKLKV